MFLIKHKSYYRKPKCGLAGCPQVLCWLWSLAWLETQNVCILPAQLCSHSHHWYNSLFVLKSEFPSSLAFLLLFCSLSWHKPPKKKSVLFAFILPRQGNCWTNAGLFVQQLLTKGMEKRCGNQFLKEKKSKWLDIPRADSVGEQPGQSHALCAEGPTLEIPSSLVTV